MVFGLGGQESGAALVLEVEHRPQLGEDVESVQAQVVRLPARAEGGGQVAVSGPVDLLNPGAEAGQRFAALVGWELPPLRYRVGEVVFGISIGEHAAWPRSPGGPARRD